ncbi:cadherin-like protein 26 isoform X2 [Mugil cephalus]|uniref:cadherin-like protein 26 isoform X2 n=1 Tax=Mugil cephalus TaxID=48193 RepID=UPI001FB7AA8E|nr:cadherin-like protein 26 isoform X2 [Mugil cephalus]
MRIISLLVLVALAAVAESCKHKHKRRDKREVLVRSKRRWVLSTIELEEEKEGTYPMVISQMFNDKTPGRNHKFMISGDGVAEGLFTIDETTGTVYAHRPVDREKKESYHITFDVIDRNTNKDIDRELAFDVAVKDINDNPPIFHPSVIIADVDENSQPGYLPAQLLAFDADQNDTDNSKTTFTVLKQNPIEPKIGLLRLSDRMAQLTFEGCFDYDKVKQYEVIVEAKDHGTPTLSSTAVVTLNIHDKNSHPPKFKMREYRGEAFELTIKKDVLRVSVEDKDTPKTDGWRAEYFFIKGNEEGIYKIETDPDTNEGILSIVKEKNYKLTTNNTLQIGVKNVEELFVCGKPLASRPSNDQPLDTVNITMTMIDANDPPEFERQIVELYTREEEKPGQLLFTPKVHDVDSKNIRYELVEDPAGWMKINGKTGDLRTVKTLDRESPYVKDNVYRVVMAAIDDGQPPATSTCIINVNLRDINDHKPSLVNGHLTLCGNKDNKVVVSVEDMDAHPYAGPFSFSLADDDLKELWKLEPAFGEEGGLVTQNSLPYGNYSVPLKIQDQQGSTKEETLEVTICNCGEGDVCLAKQGRSVSLGPAGIGLLIAGLLLMLLLVFAVACGCGPEPFKQLEEEKGNETLINYCEEGGVSANLAVPKLSTKSKRGMSVLDGIKQGSLKTSQSIPVTAYNIEKYNSGMSTMNSGFDHRGSVMSHGMQGVNYTMSSNNTNHNWRGSSNYQRSRSMYGTDRIGDYLQGRLLAAAGNNGSHDTHLPYIYADEGEGSVCLTLDQLSVSNLGDDLQFLDNLGPKFKTLGNICQQDIQPKTVKL